MEKLDILETDLCIQRVISVIKHQAPHHQKIFKTNGRHSDAFVYILDGSCTYHFDDGITFTVEKGNVLYLAHHAVYTMHVLSHDYQYIFCDFEFSETKPKNSAVYILAHEQNMDARFVRLLHCHRGTSVSAKTESMSLLYQIYSILQQNAARSYLGTGQEARIALAKRQIDEHYNQPTLSISALAEQTGISEVYFRKLFKARYHLSPSQYLIGARLENAKKLMRYSFLSVEECALRSGFSSVQYFCRLFKKETGISPGEYRKSIF